MSESIPFFSSHMGFALLMIGGVGLSALALERVIHALTNLVWTIGRVRRSGIYLKSSLFQFHRERFPTPPPIAPDQAKTRVWSPNEPKLPRFPTYWR